MFGQDTNILWTLLYLPKINPLFFYQYFVILISTTLSCICRFFFFDPLIFGHSITSCHCFFHLFPPYIFIPTLLLSPLSNISLSPQYYNYLTPTTTKISLLIMLNSLQSIFITNLSIICLLFIYHYCFLNNINSQ